MSFLFLFLFFFILILNLFVIMDTILHYSDQFFFDTVYAKIWPSYTMVSNTTGAIVSSWPREDFWRIHLSVFAITCIFGWALYLLTATLSYYLVFDHDYMKHPKFLKNQVRMEIECAVSAIPWMTRTLKKNTNNNNNNQILILYFFFLL